MRRKKERMKKLLFGTGIFFLCYGPVSPGGAVVDRIVAVVNQEVITFSEIEKWSRPFHEEIQAEDRLERRERIQEVFRKVLDRIIEEKLIEQEARKSGIKVTSKEIDAAVEEVKQKNKISQEELEKALAADGLTLGGEPPPFEEIKEKVQADYYEKELEKAYQQFLSKLKEKSVIEIKL